MPLKAFITKEIHNNTMEKKFKRTTVTSALPYANGPVHIGHLAGVYVPADIYVRYLRLKKEDVIFIGGSDEHGVPITIRAKKEGITPARRGGPLSYAYKEVIRRVRHFLRRVQPYYFKDASRHGFRLLPQAVR